MHTSFALAWIRRFTLLKVTFEPMGLRLRRWFNLTLMVLNLYFRKEIVWFQNSRTLSSLRQELLCGPRSEHLSQLFVLEASSRCKSTIYLVLFWIWGLSCLFVGDGSESLIQCLQFGCVQLNGHWRRHISLNLWFVDPLLNLMDVFLSCLDWGLSLFLLFKIVAYHEMSRN
jgi:hypothetical protein